MSENWNRVNCSEDLPDESGYYKFKIRSAQNKMIYTLDANLDIDFFEGEYFAWLPDIRKFLKDFDVIGWIKLGDKT